MADIELVVKMPENTYRQIQALVRNGYFEHDICGNSMRRIANGTPLPKGHGRLKDVDHCIKMQWEHPDYSLTDDEPTIIEADTENIEADGEEREER